MAEVVSLSTTDASNTARFPEGQAPSTVNNGARALEGMLARNIRDTQGYITAGGTANAITIALNATTAAAAVGEAIRFKAAATNTGAVTVTITPSGGAPRGAVAVQRDGAALTGGEIVSGAYYTLEYDGTQYQLSRSSNDNWIKGQKKQSFAINLTNTAGTLQHYTNTAFENTALGNFADKVSGASASAANTPTGADASTNFTSGWKISATDTERLVANTAAQTVADMIGSCVIEYNDTGTALVVYPVFASRNVNGTTQIRLEIGFRNASTGAKFPLTTANIAAGKVIAVKFVGYLA